MLLHFPEFKTHFEPKIGDMMLIKASLIQHTTRIRDSMSQLGMYVYMQASFFLIWRIVQEDLKMAKNGIRLNE